jgi:hypothetical protein
MSNTKATYSRSYHRTHRGYLVRAYRNMINRTTGLTKPHLYKGLSLLPKEEFYRWSLANKHFLHLFRVWTKYNYDRRLSPSVNRIDSRKGYDLSNIEWISQSANSALGAMNRARKSVPYQVVERLYKSQEVA